MLPRREAVETVQGLLRQLPDSSATSQLLGDLAFHLAEAGCDVQIPARLPEAVRG